MLLGKPALLEGVDPQAKPGVLLLIGLLGGGGGGSAPVCGTAASVVAITQLTSKTRAAAITGSSEIDFLSAEMERTVWGARRQQI